MRPTQSPIAKNLIERAREVRKNAYSPYYGVFVGAALLSKSQKIYVGCNVENASGAAHSGCAEANAVTAAIAAGEREFEAIAVVAFEDKHITPCGPCRQKLFEFASDLNIYMGKTTGNDFLEITLSELLPYSFKL